MRALEQVLHHCRALKRSISVQEFSNAEKHACGITKNIFDSAPVLGLDLDGTIDESVGFFQILTATWPGAVIIITYRDDKSHAIDYLKRLGIYFDEVVLVNGLDKKAEAIKASGVNIYVDDQDECLANIPEDVTVFKIRNGGNFDDSQWLYSAATGRSV